MKFKTIIKASYSIVFLSFQKVLHWEHIKFTAFKNYLAFRQKYLLIRVQVLNSQGKYVQKVMLN